MSLIALGLMAGGAGALDSYLTGGVMKREALQGLEAFEPQQLVNPFESLKPSLQLEQDELAQISQTRAGAFEVAQGMDVASAMGLSSNVAEATGEQQRKMFASMSKQQSDFDVMAAQDETRKRAIQEQRDADIVASLQDQLAAGRQMRADALMGFGKMALAGGLSYEDRLAGTGMDPLQTKLIEANKRIEAGEGTASDYMLLQQYGNASRSFFGLEPR